MSAINVTSATNGAGYVAASTLQPADTFVFNDQNITDKVFFVKLANSLDYCSPLTGAVAALTSTQLVKPVTVSAQIAG